MSAEVKRFQPLFKEEIVQVRSGGDYVLYSDYESLRRATVSMEVAQEMSEALTELRDWYLKNVGLPAVAANAALEKFNREKGGQG